MKNALETALLAAAIAAVAATPGAAQEARDPDRPVFREKGEASWYGDELEGEPTASGEPFDPDELTAAHPELPLGSKATVTNTENGEKVEVEINDRGPYADDRSIDVSKAAARKLDLVDDGEAEVEIEATKGQVEEAIDKPAEVRKVEKKLKEARGEAAEGGTRQPPGPIELEGPDEDVATGG